MDDAAAYVSNPHERAPKRYRIAAIPGDGIGVEVVPVARTVLEVTAAHAGFACEWTEFDWGCERFLREGSMMPPDAIETLTAFDAIFLGAVGDKRVPDHVSLWGLLIPIRRGLRQSVNLRPIRLLEGVPSPLAGVKAGDIDFLCIRENNEGEYSEIGGRLYAGREEELAIQEAVFTRHGVERVMRYAFARARERRGRLASITKSNGIVHTMPFWDQVCLEIAAEYPDVRVQAYHADAAAARFVLQPQEFDVVVASNLFGDMLTDLGAAIVGSIGIEIVFRECRHYLQVSQRRRCAKSRLPAIFAARLHRCPVRRPIGGPRIVTR